jgi:hypothetical protein
MKSKIDKAMDRIENEASKGYITPDAMTGLRKALKALPVVRTGRRISR